ncbi:MAG: coiled coil domain-containing protein [Betaproteobacteria bacterium]|jgi:hypothetical protein|nr:coiled coil domain-containing protein [Betaproteobacteria bacterium]
MGMKNEYVAIMESQIKTWDAEVDKLSAIADKMNADARTKYGEHLKKMRTNRDAAYKKLQEMQAANESAWQQMKADMEGAWAAMKSATDQASALFKQ